MPGSLVLLPLKKNPGVGAGHSTSRLKSPRAQVMTREGSEGGGGGRFGGGKRRRQGNLKKKIKKISASAKVFIKILDK